MKRIYLVKKDPEGPDRPDNWEIMNGTQFSAFLRTPEGKRRKRNFERLEACGEDDCIIVAECGEDRRAEWQAERDRRRYVRGTEKEHPSVSLYAKVAETDLILAETVGDPAGDVVETVLAKIEKDRLTGALSVLDPSERQVIALMYLSSDPMTRSAVAAHLGISKSAVRDLKCRAFRKLKRLFEHEG